MNKENHKILAERFLRGVYGGDPSVVDTLAANDILLSYPIFKTLFNSLSIRGRDAVKEFSIGFSQRWTESQIMIHEAIAEDNRVVLIWSFQGRNIGSVNPEREPSNQIHEWGGITLFRFNNSSKIIAEIGEESSPGPFERETVI